MKIVFTVDVDRDAVWPKKGSLIAQSRHARAPLFESTKKGMVALLELVNDFGIPTTFFFEASTALRLPIVDLSGHEVACHGLDHEDFTGQFTGLCLDPRQRYAILQKAKNILEETFGTRVFGFRAPYLHWDLPLLRMLSEIGFAYDSSVTDGQLATPPLPELFLPAWRDDYGKPMSGYLWPLMEGRRKPAEYVAAVENAEKRNVPYVVLSTHSWHTHCSVGKKRLLHSSEVSKNIEALQKVLEGISGFSFGLGKDAALRQRKYSYKK